MLGVAVRERVRKRDVALHRSRRQSGRRPGALHVEDHARHLGEISVARVLRHQRDSRARRRRHRARARPARAEDDAGCGQLVLGLHDRNVALAGLFVDAIAIAILQ